MSLPLSGPMLPPGAGAPRQLVVLLHGYGADGNDLIDLGRYWRAELPQALFIAPDAPDPCAETPFGRQWFPLALDRTISRVTGAAAVRGVVVGFLEVLWRDTGLGPRDTFLVGFSQGAMVALHVGLSLDQAVAGIVSFSGALIPPDGFAAGLGVKPPVCLVHGDLDQVVDPRLSAEAAAALRAQGHAVEAHVSAGTAHGIAPDGLAVAAAFMRARLAGQGAATARE